MTNPSFETMSRGKILDWLYGTGQTFCHQVCKDRQGYSLQLMSEYGMVSVGGTSMHDVLLRAAYAVANARLTSMPQTVEGEGSGRVVPYKVW